MLRFLLVVIPLLLLAALGLRGLQVSRRMAHENAVAQVERSLRETLTQPNLWPIRPGEAAPASYPAAPGPAGPNAAQALYARAQTAPRDEALRLLAQLATEQKDALAVTGIPLLPLVEWSRLSLESDPALLSQRAEAVARAAVETHPSAVTSVLLAKTGELLRQRGADTGFLAPWRERWAWDEKRRELLRSHEAELSAAHFPLWISAPGGESWWIEKDPSGTLRLAAMSRIAPSARGLAAIANGLMPSFAAADLTLGGVSLLKNPPRGEVLAQVERDGVSLVGILVAPEKLYAQQRLQTLWLAALLCCGFAGALLAFWTMARTLQRERQLSALKSDFVSSVSHELRAPVASMRLMAENLQSGVATGGEYHRLIAEECRRLSTLIDNVLDVARIEQNRKVYRFAETDIEALVREAIQLMQPRAGERIAAEIAEIPPPICDGLAIQQALINLLDNAIKFSPAGTEILVKVRPVQNSSWSLSVADEGRGVPKAEHHKIFERFYRTGSELRRETQGAGIGLSIVKHIAEAHAGKIEVSSVAGAGAVFTMVLPLRPCLES